MYIKKIHIDSGYFFRSVYDSHVCLVFSGDEKRKRSSRIYVKKI